MPPTYPNEELSFFTEALRSADLDDIDAATELLCDAPDAQLDAEYIDTLREYLGTWPSLLNALNAAHEATGARRYRFGLRMLQLVLAALSDQQLKRSTLGASDAMHLAQMAEYEAQRSREDRWLWAVFRQFPSEEYTVRALIRFGFGPDGRGASQRFLSHISKRTQANTNAGVQQFLSRLHALDALSAAVRTAKTYADDVSALARPITGLSEKRPLSFDELTIGKKYIEDEVRSLDLSPKH